MSVDKGEELFLNWISMWSKMFEQQQQQQLSVGQKLILSNISQNVKFAMIN